MASEKYQVQVNEQDYQVEVAQNGAAISVDGQELDLDLKGNAKQGFHLLRNHKSHEIHVIEADYESKEFLIEVDGEAYPVKVSDRFDILLKDLGMEHLTNVAVNDLKAPMPGLVLDIKVEPGQSIKKGQALLVLEAMKMENVLKAESDTIIKSIECTQGQAVEKNEVLIEFEA